MPTQTDLEQIISNWWGGTYQNTALTGLVQTASNFVYGTNPAYGASDFYALYPKFGGDPPLVPPAVVNIYISLASAMLNQGRWLEEWYAAMGLCVAHFCTLWLLSEGDPVSTPGQAAQAGMYRGMLSSKAVGDVSASYFNTMQSFGDWGAWNQTMYGIQLETMAKIVGWGTIYIW